MRVVRCGHEKGRGRRVEFIPVEVVRRAVQCVAAGLGDQVYGTTCVASRLWAVLCLRREFVNRVNRQDNTGNARDSTLVNRGDVVPEVVIVHAINLPVHLIGAGSIERTEATHVIAAEAGFNRDQLGVVASV